MPSFYSVLGKVHTLFQNEFSTQCDLVFPLSKDPLSSRFLGHPSF